MEFTKIRELLAEETSLDELDFDLGQGRISDGCHFMLRGEPSTDFKLVSSFFRDKRYKSISFEKYYGKYNFDDEEFDRGLLFANCGIIYFDSDNKNLLNFPHFPGTMISQHTGKYRTPLLDVSYHIFAPIYFACKTYKDKSGKNLYSNTDGRIYRFREKSGTLDPNKPFSEFIINASIPTPHDRMMKQDGEFIATFMIKDGKSYFSDISKSRNLSIDEYIIPKAEKPKFIKMLEAKFGNNLDRHFGF